MLTFCTYVIKCRTSESGTLVGTGWDPLFSLRYMPDNVTQTSDTNKAASRFNTENEEGVLALTLT